MLLYPGPVMYRGLPYDDVKKIAQELCVASGHDPFEPRCDVLSPDDPWSMFPWASFRQRAAELIYEAKGLR